MLIRKKPDLLATLAIIVGIGVIISSFTHGISSHSPEVRAAQLITANPALQSGGPTADQQP